MMPVCGICIEFAQLGCELLCALRGEAHRIASHRIVYYFPLPTGTGTWRKERGQLDLN